jgi:hypothetical protein
MAQTFRSEIWVAHAFRSEIRVTAITTPTSSTSSPKICAPNSELPSESGMVEESATGCAPPLAPPACVPGARLGTTDGLICGKRFEALPAGIVAEVPGTPATAGSGPIGRPVPRL